MGEMADLIIEQALSDELEYPPDDIYLGGIKIVGETEKAILVEKDLRQAWFPLSIIGYVTNGLYHEYWFTPTWITIGMPPIEE